MGSICATEAAAKCLERYGNCMIEEFIAGREITVGVLNGKALPIIEIKPNVGFYDYNAKYLDDNTQYLFDTISDDGSYRKGQLGRGQVFRVAGLPACGEGGLYHHGRIESLRTGNKYDTRYDDAFVYSQGRGEGRYIDVAAL